MDEGTKSVMEHLQTRGDAWYEKRGKLERFEVWESRVGLLDGGGEEMKCWILE